MLRKNIFAAIGMLLGGVALLSSCGDETSPGWEYMPDMYRGPALEAYQPYALGADSMSAMKPVEGTIARGFTSYEKFENNNEGYELAKANMKAPASLVMDSIALLDAAKLYGIYCGHCHGEKGDGQGILVKREKFLGVPSYADREITEGSIFHVVTYGKGVMGSHAAQLSPDERWKIANYVMQLRGELTGETVTEEATEAVEEVSGEETTTEDNQEIKQS